MRRKRKEKEGLWASLEEDEKKKMKKKERRERRDR